MKELEPLIGQVVDIVKGTKEFVLAQAPDFIRQFIIYSCINTIGWIVFSVICGGVIVKFAFWLKKNWDEVDELVNVFGTIAIIVAGLISGFGVISNICDLFLMWLSPKVYIVTHIAACLSGSSK